MKQKKWESFKTGYFHWQYSVSNLCDAINVQKFIFKKIHITWVHLSMLKLANNSIDKIIPKTLCFSSLYILIRSNLFPVFLMYIVVGDSLMSRIMDWPKENINQELNWENSSSNCSKHLACLRVRWTKESRLKDFWIHLCGTHISVLSYLFIDT